MRKTRGKSGNGASQLLLVIVAIMVSALFGLIAVTANPVLLGMSFAMIVGVFFLPRPAWSINFLLYFGLFVVGVLPVFFGYVAYKMSWGLSMLGFILLGSALFRISTTPRLRDVTPGFIWVGLLFMVYAIGVTIIQWYSFAEFLGGFKRYFQVWGLMFALCWLTTAPEKIKSWRMLMLVLACAQLPFALFELFYVVPKRELMVMSLPGIVPIDAVAGTFGTALDSGGANSAMALFLVTMLAFVLARFREKVIGVGKMLLLGALIMAPLFLGETKAVVLWLPLMFMVLYRKELLTRPHYAVLAMLAGLAMTMALVYAYMQVTGTYTFQDMIDQTLDYNVERGYGGRYLNRTTVISFWAGQQGLHDPVGFLLGNGMGSAHGGGHVDMKYQFYGIGLTAASTLLWEMGVLGTLLLLAMFTMAWKCASQLYRQSQDSRVRADAMGLQVAIALMGIFLFFRPDQLDIHTFQITFFALLGYLAWLYRQHRELASDMPN